MGIKVWHELRRSVFVAAGLCTHTKKCAAKKVMRKGARTFSVIGAHIGSGVSVKKGNLSTYIFVFGRAVDASLSLSKF